MIKEKIQKEIRKLAKDLNAVIMAHNYQPSEILEVADFYGDSLELSIKAMNNNFEVIVFCGVRFMAETASILSPNKVVLLPDIDATCPMVEMINPNKLSEYLYKFPHLPVVTYVNSSAEIKAMSTICCTSANALLVVNSLEEEELLMIPDKNLAKNTAKLTNKKIHTWNGFCPVHNRIKVEHVEKIKKKYPKALFMAHPECCIEVTKIADQVLSTSGMIKYAYDSKKRDFIVGTEIGLIYSLKKKNPNKNFYPVEENMLCPDMKRITLEKILLCLKNRTEEIKVSEKIRKPALVALKRMINLPT